MAKRPTRRVFDPTRPNVVGLERITSEPGWVWVSNMQSNSSSGLRNISTLPNPNIMFFTLNTYIIPYNYNGSGWVNGRLCPRIQVNGQVQVFVRKTRVSLGQVQAGHTSTRIGFGFAKPTPNTTPRYP